MGGRQSPSVALLREVSPARLGGLEADTRLARLTLVAIDGAWKIVYLEVLKEERIDPIASQG